MAPFSLIDFDHTETLLDLETMEPIFQRIFGEKKAMRFWFANLILYAALTVAGRYVPLIDIGAAVRKMLDAWHQHLMTKTRRSSRKSSPQCRPHPEVPAGLRKLRDRGFSCLHPLGQFA